MTLAFVAHMHQGRATIEYLVIGLITRRLSFSNIFLFPVVVRTY